MNDVAIIAKGPSVEDVRSLYRYNPNTGKVFAAKKSGRWPAGREIGANDRGYIYTRLIGSDGTKYKIYNHIIAWVLVYGEFPQSKIGHRNDDWSDNRIENLFEVNNSNHVRRHRMKKNNISGVKGVFWERSRGLWRAEITVNYKNKFLGRYADKHDALAAYIAASEEYHGDYGRVQFSETAFR